MLDQSMFAVLTTGLGPINTALNVTLAVAPSGNWDQYTLNCVGLVVTVAAGSPAEPVTVTDV